MQPTSRTASFFNFDKEPCRRRRLLKDANRNNAKYVLTEFYVNKTRCRTSTCRYSFVLPFPTDHVASSHHNPSAGLHRWYKTISWSWKKLSRSATRKSLIISSTRAYSPSLCRQLPNKIFRQKPPSAGIIRCRPSQSEALVISQEWFDLESPNLTRTSTPTHSPATTDMTSLAASGRHLSKFGKTTVNAASDGFGRILVARRIVWPYQLVGLALGKMSNDVSVLRRDLSRLSSFVWASRISQERLIIKLIPTSAPTTSTDTPDTTSTATSIRKVSWRKKTIGNAFESNFWRTV